MKKIIKRNTSIAVEMAKSDINQRELSEITGISRTILNQIITGRINAREDEKGKIANALETRIERIFGA